MVESMFSGRVRGRRANRQFGLQQAASRRADERFQLDRRRLGERQRQANVEEQRASRNERKMADAISRRLGAGITTPPQIIKEADPFQDQSITRLTGEEEQPILAFLERQGKQASAVFRRGDGSFEIMNPGGQSAVIPGNQLSDAMKREAFDSRKQEAKTQAMELRQKEMKLREDRFNQETEKERKETEGMTASDARMYRIYTGEWNTLYKERAANRDEYKKPMDSKIEARIQEQMDKISEYRSRLRKSYAEKSGVAEPSGPAADPDLPQKLVQLRAIQNNPDLEEDFKKMAGITIDELLAEQAASSPAATATPRQGTTPAPGQTPIAGTAREAMVVGQDATGKFTVIAQSDAENFKANGGKIIEQRKQGGTRRIDGATAQSIFDEVGGDKMKARELAKKRGLSF